jgi:hypothetical protein
MWPFDRKPEPTPPSNEASPEDLQAAVAIQQRCKVGELFAGRLTDPDEDYEAQFGHYSAIRSQVILALDPIVDDFCRDFAAHNVISLCMAGGEEILARAILVSVRDDMVREQIFEQFPQLQQTLPRIDHPGG